MIVLQVFGVLLAALAVLAGVFVVSMRTKFAPVQGLIRGMNKKLWNPMAMKEAGDADAKYSVIRHVGRTSGKTYETPVAIHEAEGALWVVLPYGTKVDWYKNLVAAGGGSAVHRGEVIEFGMPEVVSTADVLNLLPENEHGSIKTFKVDQSLRLEILSRTDADATV